MELLAWAITLIATFGLGYIFRSLKDRVKAVEEMLKQKVDRPKKPEEPQSTLIDPLDEIQEARFEMEQRMKKLNPNE